MTANGNSSTVLEDSDKKGPPLSDNRSESLQKSLRAVRSLHEIEMLKFRKHVGRRKLIMAASLVLLVLGAVSLIESVVLSSAALAFIGLGLTFWSLLFMFVGPARTHASNWLILLRSHP